MAQRQTGRCMCGACTFSAVPGLESGTCHCSMCRRFSGGMFIVADCGDTLVFDAGAPITVFQSSDWGERVFCSKCGSSMAWRMQDGSMAVVSVQCFEDPSQFPIKTEIFMDCKPEGYDIANATEKMTEAEFMAQYASNSEGAK